MSSGSSYLELRIHTLRPGAAGEVRRRMREHIPALLGRAGVPLPLASWTDAAGRRAGSHVCVLGWDSTLNILNRDAKQGHDAIARTELPFLQERGAAVLGAYTVWYGTRTPQAVVLLAWPDMSTRLKALAEYDIDPAVLVRAQERRVFGRPLFGRTDSMLLRPEAEVRLPLAG